MSSVVLRIITTKEFTAQEQLIHKTRTSKTPFDLCRGHTPSQSVIMIMSVETMDLMHNSGLVLLTGIHSGIILQISCNPDHLQRPPVNIRNTITMVMP